MKRLTYLTLFLSLSVLAADKTVPLGMHDLVKQRAEDAAKAMPLLVDLKTRAKPIPAADPEHLLPNRLYLRYEPTLKGRVFDITDEHGQFQDAPEPRTVLGVKSTIPGPWAGGDEKVWYILEGKSHELDSWEEMPNPGQSGIYFLINLTSPKKRRTHPHSVKEPGL